MRCREFAGLFTTFDRPSACVSSTFPPDRSYYIFLAVKLQFMSNVLLLYCIYPVEEVEDLYKWCRSGPLENLLHTTENIPNMRKSFLPPICATQKMHTSGPSMA